MNTAYPSPPRVPGNYSTPILWSYPNYRSCAWPQEAYAFRRNILVPCFIEEYWLCFLTGLLWGQSEDCNCLGLYICCPQRNIHMQLTLVLDDLSLKCTLSNYELIFTELVEHLLIWYMVNLIYWTIMKHFLWYAKTTHFLSVRRNTDGCHQVKHV